MAGAESPTIFRYDAPARRRAFVLLLMVVAVGIALVVVLLLRWGMWGLSIRIVALLLLAAILTAVRAQLARLRFRLILDPHALAVKTPVSSLTLAWSSIREVQRMNMPQVGRGARRWACAVWTAGPSGHRRPVYLFDSDMENAAMALELIYMYTPHARHPNREAAKPSP